MLLDRLMVALHHALEDEDGNPRKINEVYRDGSFISTTKTLSNADKGKLNAHLRPRASALHHERQPLTHHLNEHQREELYKKYKDKISLLQPELSSALLGDEFPPSSHDNGTKN